MTAERAAGRLLVADTFPRPRGGEVRPEPVIETHS